jgi:3-hydroxyisobutyrate dehydrogenase-like beta-hydroxyacid dehydrogenase
MKFGWIGVGNMGLPMAERLLDAGHQLVVYDIDASALAPLTTRQAIAAESPKAVADAVEIVIVSLPHNDASRAVITGTEGVMFGQQVRLVVNTCTTGSPFAREMTTALGAHDIQTLESPISGGPPGASAGTLSIMVSGPQSAFDEMRPALEALGKTVTYCGDKPGLAQVAKLANNILSATALVASLEALAMGVKAGLDVEVMLAAINGGSGRNSATLDKIPRDVITGSFAYGAPMHILMKDIDLALAEGEALGVPQMVCQQVRQMYKLAMHKGWRDRDITELALLIEDWSGCEIRATPKP